MSKYYVNSFNKIISYFLIIFCLITNILPIAAFAKEEEVKTIKIGFYASDGYHMIDEEGIKSGYGYELLQLMSRYSDIKYEYIGYDKTRNDIFELLANGEIDLLTSAHKTPERLEEFDFSEISTGNCSIMITVKAGNVDIIAGDYNTYNGINIGLLQDDIHNGGFEEFAAEKGFSYTPIYYENFLELSQALESGEIDASVTRSVRVLGKNEWVLETFNEEPMYIIVKKGNEEMLQLVNEILEKLDRNEPSWRLQLFNKYYPDNKGELLNFSFVEREYMQELKEEGKVFQVLVNPDRYPYSYIENGTFQGIMVDIFAKIAKKAGIAYELIMVRNSKEYIEVLTSGIPDICIDCHEDFSVAEKQGYKITDTYLEVPFSWVYLEDFYGKISKAAKMAYTSVKKSELNVVDGVEYIEYPSQEECVEAVRNKEVDGFCTYTLTAQKVVWEDEHSQLRASLSTYTSYYNIGVAIEHDHRLVSILNRVIHSLEDDYIDSVVNKYSHLGEKKFTIIRLCYEYPIVILVFVVLVMFLAMFGIRFSTQTKYQRSLMRAVALAEEANSAKSDFLSRMSHDIRTPINGIKGMIEIAKRNTDDKERVQQCLEKMDNSTNHLIDLVNDVLNISKIEKNSKELKNNAFYIMQQLEFCVDIVEGKIGNRALTFEHEFKNIKHPYLIGSELYLNEILINILSNSVKYTKDGGTIRFLAEEILAKTEGKAAFRFTVEDTGIGISEHFLKKIFEPFTQEVETSRTSYQGTGLGMTIVKQLLDKLGGTIEIKSKLGEGSRFIVCLEFEIDKEAKIQEVTIPEIKEEVANDLSGMKVLVVDDVELNIEIIQSILEDEGVTVITACNGAEAVNIFSSLEPGSLHLILMDIRMPVLDGIEATKRIRNMPNRSDAATIPIVAITANSDETDEKKSKAAKMNGHMKKPIEFDELISMVSGYHPKNRKNKIGG